jgi:hypothetical protein
LADPHREVFQLRQVEGLSAAEATEIVGCTVNHVGVLFHRARVRLRACIKGKAGVSRDDDVQEVSTIVSTGEMRSAPARQRLAAWIHLAMCRHCRAFRRQVDALTSEPSSALEHTIVNRLRR